MEQLYMGEKTEQTEDGLALTSEPARALVCLSAIAKPLRNLAMTSGSWDGSQYTHKLFCSPGVSYIFVTVLLCFSKFASCCFLVGEIRRLNFFQLSFNLIDILDIFCIRYYHKA